MKQKVSRAIWQQRVRAWRASGYPRRDLLKEKIFKYVACTTGARKLGTDVERLSMNG